MLTGSPSAVKSLDPFIPTMPTNATPVCTPAPSGTQGCSPSAWPVARSSAAAASTARRAWSGPVISGTNSATTSSPTNFSMIASASTRTSFDAL